MSMAVSTEEAGGGPSTDDFDLATPLSGSGVEAATSCSAAGVDVASRVVADEEAAPPASRDDSQGVPVADGGLAEASAPSRADDEADLPSEEGQEAGSEP